MMTKDLTEVTTTVGELEREKKSLRDAIGDLLAEFTQKTGVEVNSIVLTGRVYPDDRTLYLLNIDLKL